MASIIVLDCQRANPNPTTPKISVSITENVIAASTAVDPSSHPRLWLLPRISISVSLNTGSGLRVHRLSGCIGAIRDQRVDCQCRLSPDITDHARIGRASHAA